MQSIKNFVLILAYSPKAWNLPTASRSWKGHVLHLDHIMVMAICVMGAPNQGGRRKYATVAAKYTPATETLNCPAFVGGSSS